MLLSSPPQRESRELPVRAPISFGIAVRATTHELSDGPVDPAAAETLAYVLSREGLTCDAVAVTVEPIDVTNGIEVRLRLSLGVEV